MRRKAHAGTAIVATIEIQMIHIKPTGKKHTQTRFRSPKTKFLNTLSKETKISNSEYKALPNFLYKQV